MLKEQLNQLSVRRYAKNLNELTREEIYNIILTFTKEEIEKRPKNEGQRKLYYVSAEFLIGKLLSNNLINLGYYQEIRQILGEMNIYIEEIEAIEDEPSLGNGGLGRLAACFLDSISTLGLNGEGIGINYHFGLFKQAFKNGKQFEEPNPWMEKQTFLKDTGTKFEVEFGKLKVIASMYDIAVTGYNNGYNNLHLFDINLVSEDMVKKWIDFDKTDIEKNLTLFLYPDDSDKNGCLLRVYQQYFMVSAGAQLILKELKEKGAQLKDIHKHVVIQINDTHPTLIIPELIRLMTKEGISFEEAVDIVTKTVAYTNHTILAEALEKWPYEYLAEVVPQLMGIIDRLHKLIKERYKNDMVQIIDKENLVHMANIAIHFSSSTNGVAKLHTEILKNEELKDFYKLYPERFNNKTNGITFRRWLIGCNPELTQEISALIGEDFKQDASKLQELAKFADNKQVLEKLLEIKQAHKNHLADYIRLHENINIDRNSIFDIQIKRLHEYKRQQMNVLYVIGKYLELKGGKLPKTPITVIFGAKAAPAYTIAKDIIHLILTLQELIEKDAKVSKYLKVIMVQNYNVTYAQKLIPACDISEQISLASKEASGTGNMKFMLNGAITLGTMDGANVEIAELVGEENIYIFGKQSKEVIELYKNDAYNPKDYYEKDEYIKSVVDFIMSEEMLKLGDKVSLGRLYKDITEKDYFMALLDLKAYAEAKDRIISDYEDREAWAKKALLNISEAGFFSSDRTIEEYNREIWKL